MKASVSPYSIGGTYSLEKFLERFGDNPAKKIYYVGEERGVHKFGIDASTKMVTMPTEVYSALGSPKTNQAISLSQILKVIGNETGEMPPPAKTS